MPVSDPLASPAEAAIDVTSYQKTVIAGRQALQSERREGFLDAAAAVSRLVGEYGLRIRLSSTEGYRQLVSRMQASSRAEKY